MLYYAYGALATDRYPPLPRPPRRARLPHALGCGVPGETVPWSRPAKWWLRASASTLILAFLLGGLKVPWTSGGFIALLALFAWVSLAARGATRAVCSTW